MEVCLFNLWGCLCSLHISGLKGFRSGLYWIDLYLYVIYNIPILRGAIMALNKAWIIWL